VSDLLRLDGVSKTWTSRGTPPVHAVREVSLALAAGETLMITGPSGSGKTTLLSLAAGLVRPDAGRVWLDGEDLAALAPGILQRRRLHRIGVVFQRGLLLRHLSVLHNVALVARAAGRSRTDAYAAAGTLLERVGLAERAPLLPAALSAGEAQRAALARALVMRPRLVLADEPTAHLDSANGARVAAELRALATERGAGLLIVTHDMRLGAIADRVLRLEDGRLAAMP
jgi:ABC-type lipoprotein export system ATPase subunit